MKFGKRMRGLASKEWENDYVDYKQLKKHVRRLQTQVLLQLQQQKQCNHEKETAVDQVAAAFRGLLAREMAKLNAAHSCIQEQLERFELLVLRNALGNRWVLSPAKARSLLLDAIETSHKVDAFRRFVVLNSLALVKITKKFDKAVVGANLRLAVLEDLKQQPFYDAECLDRISVEAAALTDRIMLCVLPDGNFRLDRGEVACPICLVAEVKTPITLACAHTFCWSCLSKAAEHRFHSCPLCRKEQSLDPRYYEIDGLLKRFKRAYAFVEAGLDRAPFASYRMRQLLAEAFELVNAYLLEVEGQYAAISPSTSVCGDADERSSFAESSSEHDDVGSTVTDESEKSNKKLLGGDREQQTDELSPKLEPEPLVHALLAELERGDPVEICWNDSWYPGLVMQCNSDATYSVLWWVQDNSQRFGQRVARDQLREPHVEDAETTGGSMLIDAAAGAWRTATDWAMEPFRRLRSLSQSGSVVA